MTTHLASKILEWRSMIAVAGGYLQIFYQPLDRKQWDRAERMSHAAIEFLSRNHPSLKGPLANGIAELRAKAVLDDSAAEQEAWQSAIQALMCLSCLYGMVDGRERYIQGLQRSRREASRSLAIALRASKTAFPKEHLEGLLAEAKEGALRAASGVIEQDLREAGATEEEEIVVMTRALREASAAALDSFLGEVLNMTGAPSDQDLGQSLCLDRVQGGPNL